MVEALDTVTLDGLLLEHLMYAGIRQELIDILRLELLACDDTVRPLKKFGSTLWKIFEFVVQGTFALDVVNVSGEMLCQLQTSCRQTVGELKQRIHQEQQIPIVQQTLVHGILKLRDDKALVDYKISPLSPEVTLLKCTSDRFYVAGGGGEDGGIKETSLFLFNGSDWSELTEMSRARAGFAMAVYDGKLYVFGGCGCRNAVLDDVEIYDPAHNAWHVSDPMPRPRCYAGVANIDGVIYVIGGSSDNLGHVAHCESDAFDPGLGTWTSVRPMSTPRNSFGIAVIDDKVYILGGYDGNTVLDSSETFNPLNAEWTPSLPMLTRRCMFNVVAQGTNIYAVGGWGGVDASLALAQVEIYDTLNNTWSWFPPLLRPRGHFASVALGDKIYVIGGNVPGEDDFIQDMEVIDVVHDACQAWQAIDLPWTLVGAAAITLDGG